MTSNGLGHAMGASPLSGFLFVSAINLDEISAIEDDGDDGDEKMSENQEQ